MPLDPHTAMHFEFAHLWVFLLLPLPLLVYWLLPALRKRRSALITPSYHRAMTVSGLRPRRNAWISRKSWLSWILAYLCWAALILAAASPQLTGQAGKRTKTVRSFLIAADISFSMAQRDWKVDGQLTTRWEAVKYLTKDFITARKSDQIGLEMFATHAYLQAPLTTDLNAINWLLDQTEVGMAGQMTSIGEAIAFAIKIFRQDTLVKQRVMLLMTDGIDGGKGISPLDAAGAAKKDSILIYTLGIGNTTSGGYAIDVKTLTAIAEATGGKYFNANNQQDLEAVYTELNKLQPVEYEEETYRPIVLLYKYPLAAAIVLALLFYLINGLFHLYRRISR